MRYCESAGACAPFRVAERKNVVAQSNSYSGLLDQMRYTARSFDDSALQEKKWVGSSSGTTTQPVFTYSASSLCAAQK
jgi:hypothetical protein